MVGNFQKQLNFGKVGESRIAQYLKAFNYCIMPVYEKIDDDKIGPRVYMPDCNLIAPDMLIWQTFCMLWVEAKHKSVFTWHRITGRWVTGIDLRHYKDYLKFAHKYTKKPVWLLFLHENDIPNKIDIPYCPTKCPVGLYGGNLLALEKTENHRSDKWGRSGMVYWWEKTLIKTATLEEIENIIQHKYV